MDTVNITGTVVRSNVKRLGLNLGNIERFGPGNYLKNIMANPGGEDGVFTQLVIALTFTSNTFQEAYWRTDWAGNKKEGFWTGGSFEVLTGPNAGFTGTIVNHTRTPDYIQPSEPRNTFHLSAPFPTPLSNGNIAVIRVRVNCLASDYYNIESDPGLNKRITIVQDSRPGSGGSSCWEVWGLPTNMSWQNVYAYFMDSYGRDSNTEAGKLYLFKGPYKWSGWLKADIPTTFTVRIERGGWLLWTCTFSVGTSWAYYEHTADIPEGADPYPTSLPNSVAAVIYRIGTANAKVRVDDIFLGRTDHVNPTVFVDEVVEPLKEYKPGVLRFWGNQLGSTLIDQLVEPYSRKCSDFAVKSRYGGIFQYSLHDFLVLCQEVDTIPWYVMPPGLTVEELGGLVEYLAGAPGAGPYADIRVSQGQVQPWTTVFDKIILEYGNEMWGTGNSATDPFAGASAGNGIRLGQLADWRFSFVKASPWYSSKIVCCVGGQAGWPPTNKDIMVNTTGNVDMLAIAPYYGSLDAWSTDEDIYLPLFASPEYWNDTGMVTQCVNKAKEGYAGVEVTVYENNAHTTRTYAPAAITNQFVAGTASALAISKHSLEMLKVHGIRQQCLFSFVGFSFPNQRSENPFQVRVWGMKRDLMTSKLSRPTWLGASLVNSALSGSMITAAVTTDTVLTPNANNVPARILNLVQAYPFKDGTIYSVVLYNLDLTGSRTVRVVLPEQTALLSAKKIEAPSLSSWNEYTEEVSVEAATVTFVSGNSWDIEMGKHSMAVIQWDTEGEVPEEPPVTTLTVVVEGNGSVLRSVEPPYNEYSFVMLTAVPDTGWKFVRWEGDMTGTFFAQFIEVSGDLTVTAVFEEEETEVLPETTLTITVHGQGSIIPSITPPYNTSSVVSLFAQPAVGWKFNYWGGWLWGNSNPSPNIPMTESRTVSAVFAQLTTLTEYTIDITVEGSGTVDVSNPPPYYANDLVTLTATPAQGYTFSHWEGDLSGSEVQKQITIEGDIEVTAVFEAVVEEEEEPDVEDPISNNRLLILSVDDKDLVTINLGLFPNVRGRFE